MKLEKGDQWLIIALVLAIGSLLVLVYNKHFEIPSALFGLSIGLTMLWITLRRNLRGKGAKK